ncbi:MAG: type II toxin-antitoxin system ParD family antitoxin [Planctomycetes bacterium]|nr:type II toxin-antitoxin system ParD family antitoxin [Planctomycetota bacterium]
MNVSLTPTLEELVQRKVASGLYNSASEVIREALRLLQERDEVGKMKLEILRKEISVGLGQLERGEVSEHDDQSLTTLAADIKAKGRKRLAARKKRRA